MQLISLTFALFWLLTLIVYYMCPRFQWQILLIASMVFYVAYSGRMPLFLAGCAAAIWSYGYMAKEHVEGHFIKFMIGLHILAFFLFKLLGKNDAGAMNVAVPVGVSFFLLSSISYCMDVHWERCEPERNYAKLLLFLSFFPCIIQGPINRYEKMKEELFEKHTFSADKVCRGDQRFLWGLFKKLIIVDRLTVITGDIFSSVQEHGGLTLAVGVCCFAVELYADFSGYMDMVIGIGQTFGIELPENFRQPYLSGTIAEFWRRWHITLGGWFKDYVMYSFIMSPMGRKIGKRIKKKSKRWGKLVPALIGTMLVWGLTGLWHGLNCGYILWGIYYGIIMCISLCTEDLWKKVKRDHVFFRGRAYKLFCIVRTWFFVFWADVLICAESWENIKQMTARIVLDFNIAEYSELLAFGRGNVLLILLGSCVMFIVSIIQEKYGDWIQWLSERSFIMRWLLLYLMVFMIIMFGTYGAGYKASTFLYQVF